MNSRGESTSGSELTEEERKVWAAEAKSCPLCWRTWTADAIGERDARVINYIPRALACAPCLIQVGVAAAREKLALQEAQPLPTLLYCPVCLKIHIDRDEWATKPHKTHLCEYCKTTWKPSNVPTVGVEKL